jgi:fatty acid desaturase
VSQANRPASPRSLNLQRNKNLWISGMTLLFPYIGILAVIWLAESLDRWSVRLAALPVIALLQNHLQSLVHEGAHFQLHPKTRTNDLLTDLFCAIPFFSLIRHYRYFHFQHHRYLTDAEKDPEVEFYAQQGHVFAAKTRSQLAKMLIYDFSGYHYFQFFFSYNRYLFQETRAGRMAKFSFREWSLIIFVLSLALALIVFHATFLLAFYWLFPQVTVLFFFLKLQGYGEHALRTSTSEGCTFSHELGWFTRLFMYPLNSELHLEHHLYPTVPWYRLRSLRVRQGLGCRSYFFGRESVIKTVFGDGLPEPDELPSQNSLLHL